MRRAFLGPSLSGRLTLLSTPGEDWRVAQRQPGAGPLGSKLPVQVAQLEADSWHHPVPSSPQSPQSAPNLQHPPPPGEGFGEGTGEGTGAGLPPQPGEGPLGSKLPVHSAQLEADKWHHPVPSSPQSPQSAPNLQQPPEPPPGEGLPPLLPEILVRMYRPDSVSSPSDQPPFVLAPGAKAEQASCLSLTAQLA